MHLYLRVRKRNRVGRLPTQMTREFHPLSQIQKSAVTTKTGCQGDPLYLSIKGTPWEDGADLENKQRIRSGNAGIRAGEKKQHKIKSHSTQREWSIRSTRRHVRVLCRNRRTTWNRLNLTKSDSRWKNVDIQSHTGLHDLVKAQKVMRKEPAGHFPLHVGHSPLPAATQPVLIMDHR